MTFYLLCYFGN